MSLNEFYLNKEDRVFINNAMNLIFDRNNTFAFNHLLGHDCNALKWVQIAINTVFSGKSKFLRFYFGKSVELKEKKLKLQYISFILL